MSAATTRCEGAGFPSTSWGPISPHRERLPTIHATGASAMATPDRRSRVRGDGAAPRCHTDHEPGQAGDHAAAKGEHEPARPRWHATTVAHLRPVGSRCARLERRHRPGDASVKDDQGGRQEDSSARGRKRDVGDVLRRVLDLEHVAIEVVHPPPHGIPVHHERRAHGFTVHGGAPPGVNVLSHDEQVGRLSRWRVDAVGRRGPAIDRERGT